MKKQLTIQELQKSVAAFLIVFGKCMPADMSMAMARDLHALADQISQGGEPTVGTTVKDFANALTETHATGQKNH